ncbi:MAG: Holliday junction resolvase RuvX [Candidatus Paceibacterota bacterium]
MYLLGIDYGSKRIGLAVSDETGQFPAPLEVIVNDKQAVKTVAKVIKEQAIERVVIGRSVNFRGQPNEIMIDIERFGRALSSTGAEVSYEDETLSSKEAERLIGRDADYDARAAAVILKSYIDKQQS